MHAIHAWLDVPKTIEFVTIQSTSFCNVDCSYCYLPLRTSKARMSAATLTKLFRLIFSYPRLAETLTILWQAGEPLAPGIEYYRRAFGIIDELNLQRQRLKHCVQTNGMLLDARWVDLFRTYEVDLGISLDGPERLHDRHRRDRDGYGTFHETMRAVRLLQESALPFHVITVLTRDTLAQPGELFDFYLEHGIRQVAFNVEAIEGRHRQSSLNDPALLAEAREFYDAMLSLVSRYPGRLAIRELSSALSWIANEDCATHRNAEAEPMRIISVGVTGDLGTFSPELLGYAAAPYGEFVFGNVHCTDDLASILDDPTFLRVEADVQRGIERCRSDCEYFELCLGGAPANKLFENGSFDSTETMYCRMSKKAVVDVALAQLERRVHLD